MLRRNALFLAVTGIVLGGCAAPQRIAQRPAQFTTLESLESAFHPLCPFGIPETDVEWDHGATTQIDRDGYVLLHSAEHKVSLWVCEWVQESDLTGPGNRDRSRFHPEPRLLPGERAELSDYRGSGFDRGHQAPAADFKHSQDETDESFSLANMAPQVGYGFNQGVWRILEERTRKAAKNRGAVYIITGAMFYDPEEEDPETADGFIEFQVIGDNDVSVPTHFYKIIVDDDADGETAAIGFVFENRRYTGVSDFSEFVREIDWIEERTGFNFMPSLDDDLGEDELQVREGSKPSLSSWPAFQ